MVTKNSSTGSIHHWIHNPVGIAPLAVVRILFGMLMLIGVLRFTALGWIKEQYILPEFHFTYYGFDWVQPLSAWGMYGVFAAMGVSALAIMMGWKYRIFSTVFFLTFTYVELLDKTYYLNHYYFVSIFSFLIIFLPMHRCLSIDTWQNPELTLTLVPAWTIGVLKFQIAIVYVYAGLAKINSDWLLQALPLKIWLPANDYFPLIGPLFHYHWVAYLFSWTGMFFDCTVPIWLVIGKTRIWAFLVLLMFHAFTGWMFQIGMFPLIMSLLVLVYFSTAFHEKVLAQLKKIFTLVTPASDLMISRTCHYKPGFLFPFLVLFLAVQLALPCRSLLYAGNTLWTEEGYRFSWRVMLMEKSGSAAFWIKDGIHSPEQTVVNTEHLNYHQEKQMAMQPDMVLQFAQYLKKHYADQGMKHPIIRVEDYVTLNGRKSQLLVDPNVNLASMAETMSQKGWLLPLNEQQSR